ncbi:CTP synthase [Candidatus Woesearchaeota archaeon]|nr:MAG: CTP synthase [Candidatus Woesearchaeota archaeon]
MRRTKWVVVTGGVLSGLGKGVVTSSIGRLIKSQGFSVSPVKIDPYINLDAGTMRPTEHGEVFVTDDGGETDQDLGNYERFLDVSLSKLNNITTGQVYQKVISDERNLKYDGKCVEVIPHIPQEVKRRLKLIGKNSDFVLVEVGGTIGDYQNVLFLEALRTMRLEGEPMVFIHVAYLPIPKNIGEMKTKPAQHSVRALNEQGIQPDFIVARSEQPLDEVRREKLSLFCNVKRNNVISNPDLKSIYEVPIVYEKQNFGELIFNRFGLKYKKGKLVSWANYVNKIPLFRKKLRIGVVGKYFDIGNFVLQDSYISVIEAIKHASWHSKAQAEIIWLNSKEFEKNPLKLSALNNVHGVIVPGGFGKSGTEGKILAIQYLREHNIPFLGLCFGMQLAVVEFARNVCNLKGAHTVEIEPNAKHPVIDILPEQKKLLADNNYGATMRLGSWPATLKKGTKVHSLYKKDLVNERHRHRYEVNPEYIKILEDNGLLFSGQSPDRKLMEFMELPGHIFFIATQAHPEFKSRIMKPAPLFDGFVKACASRL